MIPGTAAFKKLGALLAISAGFWIFPKLIDGALFSGTTEDVKLAPNLKLGADVTLEAGKVIADVVVATFKEFLAPNENPDKFEFAAIPKMPVV